jgi:copper chaperone NosL
MRTNTRIRGVVSAAILMLLSCDAADQDVNSIVHEHEALTDQECGVCGMSVGMQPAPRAQVLHRDGTRKLFCSIGDWQVHLSAPSPHGKVVASFVEVMQPSEDPAIRDTEEHSWVPAEGASFVIGVPRSGIMGKSVLAYRAKAEADSMSASHPDARVIEFEELGPWWRNSTR